MSKKSLENLLAIGIANKKIKEVEPDFQKIFDDYVDHVKSTGFSFKEFNYQGYLLQGGTIIFACQVDQVHKDVHQINETLVIFKQKEPEVVKQKELFVQQKIDDLNPQQKKSSKHKELVKPPNLRDQEEVQTVETSQNIIKPVGDQLPKRIPEIIDLTEDDVEIIDLTGDDVDYSADDIIFIEEVINIKREDVIDVKPDIDSQPEHLSLDESESQAMEFEQTHSSETELHSQNEENLESRQGVDETENNDLIVNSGGTEKIAAKRKILSNQGPARKSARISDKRTPLRRNAVHLPVKTAKRRIVNDGVGVFLDTFVSCENGSQDVLAIEQVDDGPIEDPPPIHETESVGDDTICTEDTLIMDSIIKIEVDDETSMSYQTPSKVCLLSPEDEETLNRRMTSLYHTLGDLDASTSVKRSSFYGSIDLLNNILRKYDVILTTTNQQGLSRTADAQSFFGIDKDIREDLIKKYREYCEKLPLPNLLEHRETKFKEFSLVASEARGRIVKILRGFPLQADHSESCIAEYYTTKRKMSNAINVALRKEEFDVQKYCRIIVGVVYDMSVMSRLEYNHDLDNLRGITGYAIPSACFSPHTPYRDDADSGVGSSQLSQSSQSPSSVISQEIESPWMVNDCDSYYSGWGGLTPVKKPRFSDKQWIPMTELFHRVNAEEEDGEVARNFSAILQLLSTKQLELRYDEFYSERSKEVAKPLMEDCECETGMKIMVSSCPHLDKQDIYITTGSEVNPNNMSDGPLLIPNLDQEMDIHQKLLKFVEDDGDRHSGNLDCNRKRRRKNNR